MGYQIYQVDAFSSQLFKGNPAAVVPLNEWLPDDVMQQIAMENNLAETSFFVKEKEGFRIRWFTPLVEVDLCGHATLATAHVLFNYLNIQGDNIEFNSRSGVLKVFKRDGNIYLDFPSMPMEKVTYHPVFGALSETNPLECWKAKDDYLLVYPSQEIIELISPNFQELMELDCRGVIATSTGNQCDFVSRFFAPKVGINEDPVTGSAHTKLIPYWAKKLGKKSLKAEQLSKRGGTLYCEYAGERVYIGGIAKTFFKGEIEGLG